MNKRNGDAELEAFGGSIIKYGPIALLALVIFYPDLAKRIASRVFSHLGITPPALPTFSLPQWSINWEGILNAIQFLVLVGGISFLGLLVYYVIRGYQLTEHVQIIPSATQGISPRKILTFNDQLFELRRPWYKRLTRGWECFDFMDRSEVLEYDAAGNPKVRKIVFYARYPKDRRTGFHKAVKSNFPGAEIHDITRKEFSRSLNQGYGGRLVKVGSHQAYPIRRFQKESDRADMLYNLGDDSLFLIRLTPVGRKTVQKQVRDALKKINYKPRDLLHLFGSDESAKVKRENMTPDQRAKLESLYKLYTGREKHFRAHFYVWSEGPFAEADAQSLASKIASSVSYDATLKLRRLLIFKRIRMYLYLITPIPLPSHGILLSTQETANFIHFPEGSHQVAERVLMLPEGINYLEEGEMEEGTPIGVSIHPKQLGRLVAVDDEQMTKHFFLSGATGAGKSSTLVQMMQGDIDRWFGEAEEDENQDEGKEE